MKMIFIYGKSMKIRKNVVCIIVVLLIFLNMIKGQYIILAKEPSQLYSLSAVLMDADTGRVLFEKDGYTVRANASTTKIMTCILAIESGKLDELVTVSKYAKEIGCDNTYFITPNGLDASEETSEGIKIHGTTAADLAKIMAYCIRNEEYLKITQTQSYTFSSRTIGDDGQQRIGGRKYTVNNKNAFLNMMDGVLSGKTGFTGDAGYCYVAALRRDGKTFTIALLGCGWPNNKNYKWSDAKELFNYGIDDYAISDFFKYDLSLPQVMINNGVYGDYSEYGVNGINADKTPYIAANVDEEELKFLHKSDEKLEYSIALDSVIEAPVYKGQVIGNVTYMFNGEIVKVYEIKANETIEKKDYKWAIKCILNRFILS